MTDDPVLFRLEVSPARRFAALFFIVALAVLLIGMALTGGFSFGYSALVMFFGVGAAWSARALARGTTQSVELREDGLYLSGGQLLTTLDNIEKVERGIFAMKPSNGFAVKLHQAPGFAFCPGLYWQMGRTLGIGGVTPRGAAKAMADGLAMHLAMTRGGDGRLS